MPAFIKGGVFRPLMDAGHSLQDTLFFLKGENKWME